MKLNQLLTCAVLALGSSIAFADFSARIVGGELVTDNRYPFMAAIYFDNDGDGTFSQGCGGSYIGGQWILTAAHCLVDRDTGAVKPASSVAVLLNNRDLSDQVAGDFIITARVIPHPDYSADTFFADVALLELSRAYTGSSIRLPASTSGVPIVPEAATVAGWGTTSEGGQSSSDLLEVTLPVVAHATCFNTYSSLNETVQFCAGGGSSGGLDSCQGDSGGPIFVTRDNFLVQAGIVSFGRGCARPDVPGVYTRVATFTDWINSIATGTEVYAGDGTPPPIGEPGPGTYPVLVFNTPVTGTLDERETVIYDVSGADRVILTTTSGDADLFIYNSTNFSDSTLVCVSQEFTANSAIDACDTGGGSELYARVLGYEASSFSLVAEGTAPPVVNPPVVDPPVVDPPVGEPPVVVTTNPPNIGGGGGGSVDLILLLLLLIGTTCRFYAMRPRECTGPFREFNFVVHRMVV